MTVDFVVVASGPNELGESPVWDWRDDKLYWVDLRASKLWQFDPASGTTQSWGMPDLACAVVLREAGGLVIALRDGLHAFDPVDGELTPLIARQETAKGNRINDCKVDRSGCLWWSTMWDHGLHATGALYRLHPDLTVERVRDGLTVPNALAFAADGRAGTFADSATGRIEVFDIAADRAIGGWRTLAEPEPDLGKPDGATIDASGHLWVARFGGGCVQRFDRTGRAIGRVQLPARNVTSCALGGSDLSTLYVTTATQGIELSEISPLDGALLAVSVPEPGLPEPLFHG